LLKRNNQLATADNVHTHSVYELLAIGTRGQIDQSVHREHLNMIVVRRVGWTFPKSKISGNTGDYRRGVPTKNPAGGNFQSCHRG
jgi:hypothetical protein